MSSPLTYASMISNEKQSFDMAKHLINNGAKVTPKDLLAFAGREEIVSHLKTMQK